MNEIVARKNKTSATRTSAGVRFLLALVEIIYQPFMPPAGTGCWPNYLTPAGGMIVGSVAQSRDAGVALIYQTQVNNLRHMIAVAY